MWLWTGGSAPAGLTLRAPVRPPVTDFDSVSSSPVRKGCRRWPAARRLFLRRGEWGIILMAIALTAAQKRYLRGLGQALNPTLQIGREGVTAANEAALEPLLKRHELVKGKVQQTAEVAPREAAAALAQSGGAVLVCVVGRTFLLSRPNMERKDPIRLP